MLIYFYIILMCVSALILGLFFSKIILVRKNKIRAHSILKQKAGINGDILEKNFACDSLALKILGYLVKISYSQTYATNKTSFTGRFITTTKLKKKIKDLSYMANMPASFNNKSYRESQFRLSAILSLCGFVIGLVFSNLLGLILFVVGLIMGVFLPSWAMNKEKNARSEQLEKNLPEMLEVVSLGLRSGLTFDRSLNIYTQHFDNDFSSSCKLAQQKWESGVKTRELALRDLAASYESFLFSRIVDSIIRSIRFGSSLVESLEESCVEARNIYKSNQEAKVAKAPVKMMIPTGTLILPAMLLLVLGPVLLNLIGGF